MLECLLNCQPFLNSTISSTNTQSWTFVMTKASEDYKTKAFDPLMLPSMPHLMSNDIMHFAFSDSVCCNGEIQQRNSTITQSLFYCKSNKAHDVAPLEKSATDMLRRDSSIWIYSKVTFLMTHAMVESAQKTTQIVRIFAITRYRSG